MVLPPVAVTSTVLTPAATVEPTAIPPAREFRFRVASDVIDSVPPADSAALVPRIAVWVLLSVTSATWAPSVISRLPAPSYALAETESRTKLAATERLPRAVTWAASSIEATVLLLMVMMATAAPMAITPRDAPPAVAITETDSVAATMMSSAVTSAEFPIQAETA